MIWRWSCPARQRGQNISQLVGSPVRHGGPNHSQQRISPTSRNFFGSASFRLGEFKTPMTGEPKIH